MRTYFPLVGFSGVKDDALATKANTVLQAMDGHPLFPTPVPALATVQAAYEDYALKLAEARRRGSPRETTLKNQSKAVLIGLLKKLGAYVADVADGDLAVIQASGFDASAGQGAGTVPGQPLGVRLLNGRLASTLQLTFFQVPGARLYEYRYAQVPVGGAGPDWSDRIVTSNSRITIIAGLQRVTEYMVQVRAVNNYGPGDWSAAAMRVVI